MDIELSECKVDDSSISMIGKFTATFKELRADGTGYRAEGIKEAVIRAVASEMAAAYLELHRMDIIDAMDKDKIVNAVHLKIIEQFSISGRA